MKKTILRLRLLAIALMAIVSAQAEVIDGINYALYDFGQTAAVLAKDEGQYAGDIVIPSTVTYEGKTYQVTDIAVNAFVRCSGLTSIEIPAGVTRIGRQAFQGCSGLTSIEIPAGVTSIGVRAFQYCSGLTSIEIPAGLTRIESYTFGGCSSLTSIKIPAGLTRIDLRAFEYCFGLKDIYCAVEVPIQLNPDQVYWSWEIFADCALHVRPGTAVAYREADVWKNFLRIEDDFTTGVDEVAADGEACIRLTDGGLVLGGGAWTVCTPGGQCVARGTGSETLHLPAGIYVVRCGKAARTVVVK